MLKTFDLIHILEDCFVPEGNVDKEALRIIKYRLQSYDELLAICRRVKNVVEATEFFENETK